MTLPELRSCLDHLGVKVPVNELRVTRVQYGVEPRAYVEGASVDPTNGASLGATL